MVRLLGCFLIAALASGCARPLKTIDGARSAFIAGDLSTARESLQTVSKSNSRFADIAALDLAIVDLASGAPDQAEQRLRQLRDRFDQMPTVAPLHEAASLVADDTVRPFQPAGYEQVMIRTMLAVCSLASDGADAESYVMQATMKQSELARTAKERGIPGADDIYQPIAIAPYLRGVLREATHHDYDDAARAYQLVSSVQPQFAPAAADIARASGGTHSQPGHGVLYVIACVGLGPVLTESEAETTSTALSIASSVWNAETNEGEPGKRDVVLPNIAKVKVPRVIIPPVDVAAVGVRIDGHLCGATQTLTDVGCLAQNQLEAEMPWTIARAVVRRATKEIAVAQATKTLGLSGTAGSLFHFAAASSWSGIENADTRCWGLLPREIQVFRCQLPAGQHDVTVQPMSADGTTIAGGRSNRVDIRDGENEYLIVLSPGPTVHLVSRPSD